MPEIVERDIIMQSKDGAGNETIDYPITRLQNITDDAETIDKLSSEDFIPVMDSANGGQMKKVRMGSVENALEIQQIREQAAVNRSSIGLQSKNLLKITRKSNSANGVSFTINENGTIHATGTAIENATFVISSKSDNDFLRNERYIYSGCIGGGESAYKLRFFINVDDTTKHYIDVHSGKQLIVDFDNNNIDYNFAIVVNKGVNIDETFYPMLRYADIEDGTYEPYVPDLQTQINELKAQIQQLTASAATATLLPVHGQLVATAEPDTGEPQEEDFENGENIQTE